jgi:hypothetical protein
MEGKLQVGTSQNNISRFPKNVKRELCGIIGGKALIFALAKDIHIYTKLSFVASIFLEVCKK